MLGWYEITDDMSFKRSIRAVLIPNLLIATSLAGLLVLVDRLGITGLFAWIQPRGWIQFVYFAIVAWVALVWKLRHRGK